MDKTYDAAYFERWYQADQIGGAARLARKVALAVASAEYHLERPIRSVLDIGCGEGAWRAPLLKLRPRVQYLGFDSSEYAIARYGRSRNLHLAGSATSPGCGPCAPVDLLVCSDVMHYVPTRELQPGPARLRRTLRRRGIPGSLQRRGRHSTATTRASSRARRAGTGAAARTPGFTALGSHCWLSPALGRPCRGPGTADR